VNVQSTWHILYIDANANFSSWKYFGQWPGETEEDAIKESKIDSAHAATSIVVFKLRDGKRFERGPWIASD
jgi:hypothetical protein